MSDSWFCAKNKQKHGPYSTAQIREFLAQGTLRADDMVLKEGTQKWAPAASIAPKARNFNNVFRSLLENRLALVGMTTALSIVLGIVLGLLMGKGGSYKAEAKTAILDKGLTSEDHAVETVVAERRPAEEPIDMLRAEMEKLVGEKRILDEQLTSAKNRAEEAIDARRSIERQMISLKSENEKLVRAREKLVGLIARLKLPDQTRALLDMASHFELYSLEPTGSTDEATSLHGWKVLGKTTVKKAEIRKELLSALEKGIASVTARGAKCFDPRHAIRAVYEDKTVDLLICFECGWVYIYLDGEKEPTRIRTDWIAQPVLDRVLRQAGIPLAKKRGE